MFQMNNGTVTDHVKMLILLILRLYLYQFHGYCAGRVKSVLRTVGWAKSSLGWIKPQLDREFNY